MREPLTRSFYARDPLEVAQALLGAVLEHELPGGERRSGRIVETEAYRGEEDLACHASKGRTARTEVMYGPAGFAYVYLIYGMYDMFNVVTGHEGEPSAVLVRAVEPIQTVGSTNGPGRLTRALGITRAHNGVDLVASALRLLPGTPPRTIATSPRIGVDYAGEWARLPWRFFEPESRFVSRPPKRRAR